jgi:hypothetical protein
MTEDGGESPPSEVADGEMKIGVTHSRRPQFDLDLAWAGRGQLDFFDRRLFARH